MASVCTMQLKNHHNDGAASDDLQRDYLASPTISWKMGSQNERLQVRLKRSGSCVISNISSQNERLQVRLKHLPFEVVAVQRNVAE